MPVIEETSFVVSRVSDQSDVELADTLEDPDQRRNLERSISR
jgi:hypothetical protein